ncbi:24806_t:CDS:2 [Cetraspora pellucida]|uniref:24806_t:CDS:1 n=1 Tax=Cetraspora pellucida TaxID=1433469 RepID=A0A9N9ANC2_9GLOM|nr:24806_t:CDS:2 [Cetraspora pellucida]
MNKDCNKDSQKNDETVSLKTTLNALLTATLNPAYSGFVSLGELCSYFPSQFTLDVKFLSINIQVDPIVDVDDANVELSFKDIDADATNPEDENKKCQNSDSEQKTLTSSINE